MFMSYDPNQVFYCHQDIIDRTICLNKRPLMEKLNDKISFRKWAASMCEVQISKILSGAQCSYSNLCNLFKGYDSFVIQSEHGSGGEGTFILDYKNQNVVLSEIDINRKYMVSGYEKYNIPINTHAIIYKDDILIFPLSIQIMQLMGISCYIKAQTLLLHKVFLPIC